MFTFLKNVFKKGELRQKVIFTLGILFVYRLGAAITIPSVNTGALSASDATNGIFGIMNLIGGGTLERFSLFSLGVSPYITSSIIIELLSMDVIPVLSQWRKEGNTGKKKKDRVTRYVTLFLAALQGGVLTYAFDTGYNILSDSSIWTYIYVVIVMIAGSMLAVWLGDQITNKGIGNGVSLLIFTGIVSDLPTTFVSFMETSDVTNWINTIFNYQEPVGFVLYILMIIGFTFFYSNLQIDAEKISDDLKKNGGSIPGVRTGEDTKIYIKKVLNRITVVGSLSLCIIAAIPIITPVIWSQTANASLSLGGTGLIIVTGVALETVRQIKTHITRKEYHGYIRR